MQKVFETIEHVAPTEATIHIHGESGTGKELVARAIHEASPRKDGPFIAVNCGALTPSLLESELFGHQKGAFTGAIAKRIGLFQQANGGTIFLDEIAELPLDLQAKLLRVLEEREVVPLGAALPLKVDIRVISATHKSLPDQCRLGRFREDLMYRLHIVPLRLPPLRKRPDDIELLVWRFVALFNKHGHRHIEEIEAQAMARLCAHHWPGNIRELKNVIEYTFAVGRETTLRAQELPSEFFTTPPPNATPRRTQKAPLSEEEDKQRIRQALEDAKGNINKAAELAQMSRPTFWRKRKKYNL